MTSILFLWTIPRSVSTAFEKMVDNRNDVVVFGEPFIDCYKSYCQEYQYEHINNNSCYLQIIEKLETLSTEQNVFVKEMAYHVKPIINDILFTKLIELHTHTFLIRHPKYTLPSLYKMNPRFTWEETGFEQLYNLFTLARKMNKESLVVIDAQDLRKYPDEITSRYFELVGLPTIPESLHWQTGCRPEWLNRKNWHKLAIESTSFLPPIPPDEKLTSIPQISHVYERCLGYYDKLKVHKININ
jgi:Sulfotransferase domain